MTKINTYERRKQTELEFLHFLQGVFKVMSISIDAHTQEVDEVLLEAITDRIKLITGESTNEA